MQGTGKAHRVRKGFEAAIGDQPIDQRLLLLRILRRPCGRVRNAKPLERGPRAIHARLARDICLIERRREPGRIGEPGERLAPGPLVRRGHEYAIDVKDRRKQPAVSTQVRHYQPPSNCAPIRAPRKAETAERFAGPICLSEPTYWKLMIAVLKRISETPKKMMAKATRLTSSGQIISS